MADHVLANVGAGMLAMSLSPVETMRRVGLEPEGWQGDVLDARPRRLLLNVTRGGGKSTTACVMAVDELLHGRALHGEVPLVLCIAPAERQSRLLLRRVRAMYKKLGHRVSPPLRGTQTELEFEDGGLMVALPSTENIRSYQGVTLLLWEEMSRFASGPDGSDPAVDATTPMVHERGRIVGLSTPAGQRGTFWRLFTRPGDFPEWTRVTITGEQSQRISARKLAEERRRMTPTVFNAEYMCSFEDSAAQVFPTEMVRAALTTDVAPLQATWPRFAA
jgi:hypothetical protein